MGYIKPFRLVLILGILLEHGVFAAESTARSEAAGAQWAAGWLSEIQRKYNPLPVALEGTDIDLIHPEKPRFTRPLLTGPLSIFLSAGANYPLPQGQTDFQFWLTRIANDQMRQRYAKIIQDLQQHFHCEHGRNCESISGAVSWPFFDNSSIFLWNFSAVSQRLYPLRSR